MSRSFRGRSRRAHSGLDDERQESTDDRPPSTSPSTVPTRRLGATGPTVSMIGLGAMGMSGVYGARDDDVSLATIHAAVDAGVTLIDTGDFYGSGHNEMLIGRALREFDRSAVQLSVKFGARLGPGFSWGGVDTRPASMRNFLAYSLQRLGTDYLDIYRPARLDPDVPIEETVGAIAEMVEAGYVRAIGLSEVGPETIRRAAAVHPIVDLQIEYSLMSRGIEAQILPTVRELGIGITAYGVLSRGLISESLRAGQLAADDFRSHSPRFQGDNLDRNRALVERLAAIATAKGITVAQLAIAWSLTRGDDIVPLIGTSNPERLAQAVEATKVELTQRRPRRDRGSDARRRRGRRAVRAGTNGHARQRALITPRGSGSRLASSAQAVATPNAHPERQHRTPPSSALLAVHNDAPMSCQGAVWRRCWQTSDGPLEVRGRALIRPSGVAEKVERRAGRSLSGQPCGVGHFGGQARRSDRRR